MMVGVIGAQSFGLGDGQQAVVGTDERQRMPQEMEMKVALQETSWYNTDKSNKLNNLYKTGTQDTQGYSGRDEC